MNSIKPLVQTSLPLMLIADLGMLYPTETSKKKARMAEFKCPECLGVFIAQVSRIKNGTASRCVPCGRLNNILKTKEANTTHGLKKHPLYGTWRGQKKRCNCKTSSNYERYGKRGIKFAEYWENDFKGWLDYVESLEGFEKSGYTLDRVDNNKDYVIGNLRWVSKEIQSRNDRVIMCTNTSGYRGVSFDKPTGTWKTKIVVSYKNIHLGYHKTALIAARAYDTYVIKNKLEHNINGVQSMKAFLVGGAVRDALMGVPCEDNDYVVAGSSPEEMLSKGFTEVGSGFPVFLHPVSKDEYALARTEYSIGVGYKDFNCYFGEDVTLEDDLLRRDLTINSIAQDQNTGELIDPYGGIDDINSKLLRHTSVAFKDDPIRMLRLARFYARFGSEWTIVPETKLLCDEMYKEGMFYGLTPERIWKETEKALKTKQPSLYFDFIKNYGIFPEILDMEATEERNTYHPELNVWEHTKMVMDYAADNYDDSEINFACLTHDLGKHICYQERGNGHGHEEAGLPFIRDLCDRLKVPNSYKELALLVCEHHQKIHSCLGRGSNKGMKPKSIMKMFSQTNALVKPERFIKMLKACRADAAGRGHTEQEKVEFQRKPYQQYEYMVSCLEAACLVDTKEVSLPAIKAGKSGIEIGEAIRISRIDAIRGVHNEYK